MPNCDFNKVAMEFYWYLTTVWVLSCKFGACFQNTFSQEHLWRDASASTFLQIPPGDFPVQIDFFPELHLFLEYVFVISSFV